MIRLEHLCKFYPAKVANHNGERQMLRALDDISLTVESGEWLSIMGPSGSGKSTMVNLIGCLDRPTAGNIWLDGMNVAELSPVELNRARAEKIGFIFQAFHLIPYLTALENVMLAQYFHSMTDENEAREALSRVGLKERANHLPAHLSGGEQQRVCIARALINDPKIILADEPTGNLDESNETIVLKLLRDLHQQGRTIVMVTHDPTVARLADRRVDLHHGRIATQEVFSTTDEEEYDEILEEIWVINEHGEQAWVAQIEPHGALPIGMSLEKMTQLGLIKISTHGVAARDYAKVVDPCHDGLSHEMEGFVTDRNLIVEFTKKGRQRAASVIRRHRLAERLFTESLGMQNQSEITEQACKFEHILSAEATERICAFLGHPTTCPHGATIPPGECCEKAGKAKAEQVVNAYAP
jgi:putative ABC transport system ATP-binding protein